MDSTIAAALISAGASIFVALLGRGAAPAPSRSGHARRYSVPERNRRAWRAAAGAIGGWLLFAALFLHWDLAGLSGLLIPVVLIVLSLTRPVQPATAAAYTLLLFPLAFLAEPIGKWRRGMIFDNHFDAAWVGTFVGFAFATAAVVWALNRWRTPKVETPPADSPRPSVAGGALAREIAELAALHRDGVISDEEFTQAKRKLLAE